MAAKCFARRDIKPVVKPIPAHVAVMSVAVSKRWSARSRNCAGQRNSETDRCSFLTLPERPQTEIFGDFVDHHRDTCRIESICKVLPITPSGYRRQAACQRYPELDCARAKRDDTLMAIAQSAWQANLRVYGVDKVWH